MIEEDSGEIANERFLKALTVEVEEITEEAVQAGKIEEKKDLINIENEMEEHPVFLQTRMVGLSEVRRNLEEWTPSMKEEYGSLVEESEAVEPISRKQMGELKREADEVGRDFDMVPAKAIFSRKAGSGRHKCRGVACGNYVGKTTTESTYASGAGSCEVRFLLKTAAIQAWSVSTLDVKTAFLNAPVDDSVDRGLVIVEPPRIFRDAKVLRHPEEVWLVRKALYGLVTSPKDWVLHRDGRLRDVRWQSSGVDFRVEKTQQDDMWLIQRKGQEQNGWEMAGMFATYVDDIIVAGEESVIMGFYGRVREIWKIGEPAWVREGGEPVRFLGMEMEKKEGDFFIHQRAYLESLFQDYEESGRAALGLVKTPEKDESPTPEEVAQAQKETGELLWVAGRTRPDICLAVNLMCQWASKRPKGVIAIGKQVRAYLRETRDEGLLISGNGMEKKDEILSTVEVYSDASYASSELKSLTGIVACIGGTPVAWHTSRQAFITLSTAEAELMSLLESLVTVRSIGALVEAVLGTKATLKLHSDSTAAIAIAAGTTSSWRTRHLRIRAAGLTEALRSREVTLRHVAGAELVADGMTKQLNGQVLKNFKRILGIEKMEIPEKVEVKKMELGGGRPDPNFTRGLGLLIAAASMVRCAEATEVRESAGSSEWWILVLITAAIAIIGDIVVRIGTAGIRRWMRQKEELKVKLLSPEAVIPTRGSEQAAGLDLYSIIETMVPPGDSVLVKTGIALELPRGSYGRIAPRSSLAIRGIETGAGVVDRDFRGEVKVLLRNHSDVDLRIYKGDRVAQLVIERILELEVQCVDELTDTARGTRGFGYSAHEELYPWAEPDDPLYQRQELGTRNPVERISIRTLQVPEGRRRNKITTEEVGTQTPPRASPSAGEGALFPAQGESSGQPRGHDPELCHREPYDYERERERRSALGLNPAAWDRIMAKRGSRPDYGGTWVVRDSEGTRIVGVDRGRPPQETIHLPGDPRPRADGQGHLPERREKQALEEEVFEEVIVPKENTAASSSGPIAGNHDRRTFELLMGGTPEGLQLGSWEISERTTMEEFLRLPSFQNEFLSGGVKQVVKNMPHQNTRKDTWLGVWTNAEGKRVVIREHPNSRRQKYDFTGDQLWEETWSQWRLTIAWAAVGQKKTVICDWREGRRSTHLPYGWTGYTLFVTNT